MRICKRHNVTVLNAMLEKPVQFLWKNQWQIWLSHPTYFQVHFSASLKGQVKTFPADRKCIKRRRQQENKGGVKGKEKREGKIEREIFFFFFFGYALWPTIQLNGFVPKPFKKISLVLQLQMAFLATAPRKRVP